MKTRILACFIQCIILKLMTKPVPELPYISFAQSLISVFKPCGAKVFSL